MVTDLRAVEVCRACGSTPQLSRTPADTARHDRIGQPNAVPPPCPAGAATLLERAARGRATPPHRPLEGELEAA